MSHAVHHLPGFVDITSKWFNDPTSSDLEVRLKNDKVLHCHRLVLCSWSEVWAAALKDKKETSLDLTAHDPAIVEMCVRYCYSATIDVDITDDNLTQVRLFAHQYNLRALSTACEHRLTQLATTGLTISNCSGLCCYLLEHEFPNLSNVAYLESIKAFMCEEFVEVSKSGGFLRLPEKVLCQLLKEDRLVATEDDVLDACCRWLAGSPGSPNDDAQVLQRADRVLQLVRFPMLSAMKLLEFKSHPTVSQSENFSLRYQFALEWATIQLVPEPVQEPLRIKLREENKTEILTPRIHPLLSIRSQILDAEMQKTLASMTGGPRTARLLVDSSSGMTKTVFDGATKRQGPFVIIIKSSTGHVFGAYVEDTFSAGWTTGSPNNFLFSLKAIGSQQVVKLQRSRVGCGICSCKGCGLRMGSEGGLIAFCEHRTANDPAFELAPGYEAVGSKTLHGQFGDYTPVLMEVFGLSMRKRVREVK